MIEPSLEFIYPTLRFDFIKGLKENFQFIFNQQQSSFDINQSFAFISLLIADDLNNDDPTLIEQNIISSIDADFFTKTVFDYDNTFYRYLGNIFFNSLKITQKDPVLQGKFIEGNLELNAASSEALGRLKEFLKLQNQFIIVCGWMSGLSNQIKSVNDIGIGNRLIFSSIITDFNLSESENGTWNITVDFISELVEPLLKIPTRMFKNPSLSQLTTIDLIPKINTGDEVGNVIAGEDYILVNKKEEVFKRQINSEKSIIGEFSAIDYENDYYVQLSEILLLYEDLINRQFIFSGNKPIKFCYGCSDCLNLFPINSPNALIIDEDYDNTHVIQNDQFISDNPIQVIDVAKTPAKPLYIPQSPGKITISQFNSIYIPLKFVSAKWLTSTNLQEFLNEIISWVNKKYTVNLIVFSENYSNSIAIMHIKNKNIIGEGNYIPSVLLNSNSTVIFEHSLGASTPIDNSYIMALSELRTQGGNEEVYVFNLKVILENLDIFNSNFFIPIVGNNGETVRGIQECSEISNIIKEYQESNNKKEIMSKYENKLIFFRKNSSLSNFRYASSTYKDSTMNAKLDYLINQGIVNNSLYFKPLSGTISMYGNSFFSPLSLIKLVYSDKTLIYNDIYFVEEVTHTFNNNFWTTQLNISKNGLLIGDQRLKINENIKEEQEINDTYIYDDSPSLPYKAYPYPNIDIKH